MTLRNSNLVTNLRNLDRKTVVSGLKTGSRSALTTGLGVPLVLLILLGLMTLPVPPLLLDLFFTFNIALSLIVLLITIYALRPLDFAVFPTILLVATLLRLSLNVASTRIVLLYGHDGGDAAGKVIEAFGAVLIGGNYAVGLVVFAILMIINFAVVTKGAGRVSEVTARFTLDAMPGKQMAIDADLNAGLIDADTAKLRRQEVAQEADFYGSMDGASKFVRGDAIAGLLILLINIFGGLAIGMAQHGLPFGEAVEKYALLTIGDGLVAQIPSLLLSVAAAIMVTRNSSSEEMGAQVMNQMFSTPKALLIVGSIMFLLGVLPGMPHFVFLVLALAVFGLAFYMWQRENPETSRALFGLKDSKSTASKPSSASKAPAPQTPGLPTSGAPASGDVQPGESRELSWEDVQPVDMVGLEVGYRLIPLVDKAQGGQLLSRIKGVRKKLSQEVGFLMPSIHIRDNLDLSPNGYRVTLMGVTVAEAEVYPEREMAINPGQVFGEVPGSATKDPAFGLDAVWIDLSVKEQAQTLGYTVVDSSTVVATHVNQILYRHAHELLGHEEVQKLIDNLSKNSPKLAEELVPGAISISLLLKVLQNLLMEQVPIRDMRSIAESVSAVQPSSQDLTVLTAAARKGLSRLIVQNIIGSETDLPVITLDRELEQILLRVLQQGQQSGTPELVMLEPQMAEQLQQSIIDIAQKLEAEGKPIVLLVQGALRTMLARFARGLWDGINVLAFDEVPENKRITVVSTIGR